MNNIIMKNSVYLLVGVSGIVWYFLAKMSGLNLSDAQEFFSLVPKVVTIDTIFLVIFTKWLWKIKWFRGWLVPFPNLNGTWIGNIHSDWVNPKTNTSVPPIPVMLTIEQSFFHISCLMQTKEMKSYSMSEGFNIDTDRQIKQIAYIYTSRPGILLNNRSLPHDGAIVFDIIEKPQKKLKGRYWTERHTRGEIHLEFYSNDALEEMPKSIDEHPVIEIENSHETEQTNKADVK